jgi:hypothetical protein
LSNKRATAQSCLKLNKYTQKTRFQVENVLGMGHFGAVVAEILGNAAQKRPKVDLPAAVEKQKMQVLIYDLMLKVRAIASV